MTDALPAWWPTAPVDTRNQMDAEQLLGRICPGSVTTAFFDPQYDGVLRHLQLGNEGKSRQVGRCALDKMTDEQITRIIGGICSALRPSGHLFLWVDRYHLVEGSHRGWLPEGVEMVSMITWDKDRMGMGYRARCQSEFLIVIQKLPNRAKGVWTDRAIRDVWREDVGQPAKRSHVHQKPPGLLRRLIGATSKPGDLVLDPAAGGWGVLDAAVAMDRRFIGCDLVAAS